MKRWLGIAAVVLLFIWAPFVYKELSATAPEVEDGDDGLFDDEPVDDEVPEGEEPVEEAEPPAEPLPDEAAEGEAEEEGEEEGEEAAEALAEGEAPPEDPAAPTQGEVAEAIAGAFGVMASTFEDEPRDALWAGDAETRLREEIDSAELAEEEVLEIVELGCQRTLCRATLNRGVEPTSGGAFEKLMADHVGRMFQHRAEGEGEEKHFVVYLLREGYTMEDLQK